VTIIAYVQNIDIKSNIWNKSSWHKTFEVQSSKIWVPFGIQNRRIHCMGNFCRFEFDLHCSLWTAWSLVTVVPPPWNPRLPRSNTSSTPCLYDDSSEWLVL